LQKEVKKEYLEEKEGQGEKEAEKEESVTPIKKEEERVVLPFMKLEEVSKLEPKTLELSKDIIKVEKQQRVITMPIMELQPPSITLKEYELDYKIPLIEKAKKLLIIPIIKVNSPPRVSILLTKFDTQIGKPQEIILPKILVPVYRKVSFTSARPLLESFDSTISEQVTKRLEGRAEVKGELSAEKKETRPEAQKLATTICEESIVSLEGDASQLPVIPDIILDPSSEGGSLGSVTPEDPVYVVVTEKLYDIVTMLCGLVYRIKKGGLPSTWVEEKVDSEFLNRTLIERDMVMMLAKNIVEAVEKRDDLDKVAEEFRERIEGIYKEKRFRFIVLKTSIEVLDKVGKLLKEKLAHYVPKLLIYKDKKMDVEAYELLIRACWGFVSSERIIVEPGKYYNECANVFQEQIKSVVKQMQNKLNPLKWPKPSPTDEDWLHKALKYVVINHLLENEGIDLDSIETEYKYREGVEEPPIDVYVKEKGIAVEIETLYGRGEPAERINDLLRRYFNRGFEGQLWLVFPNQQALLFCDDIVKLAKKYRKAGLNVEPYILDISGEGSEMLNGRKTAPGLIKLVNVIKLLSDKGLKREVKWLGELGA
jgi:hypothetical protein